METKKLYKEIREELDETGFKTFIEEDSEHFLSLKVTGLTKKDVKLLDGALSKFDIDYVFLTTTSDLKELDSVIEVVIHPN